MIFKCSWEPKNIDEGSSIRLRECKKTHKQRFKTGSNGSVRPRSDTDLCVTYQTDSPSKGDKVRLEDCSGSSSQDWSFSEDEPWRRCSPVF